MCSTRRIEELAAMFEKSSWFTFWIKLVLLIGAKNSRYNFQEMSTYEREELRGVAIHYLLLAQVFLLFGLWLDRAESALSVISFIRKAIFGSVLKKFF